MDIGRSVNFIREDEDWIKKVLIGGALMFIPLVNIVGGFAFQGYVKKMFKNTLAGADKPLPEWDDWGTLIVDGLKIVVVTLGYMIPMMLVYGCGVIINVIAASSGADALRYVGFGCICLAFPIGIVISLFAGVGLMRFFATDSLGEAFNFGEILGFIKGNIGPYILGGLVFGILIFVCEIVGLLACGIGIFLTLPYGILSGWHLMANIYRDGSQPAM